MNYGKTACLIVLMAGRPCFAAQPSLPTIAFGLTAIHERALQEMPVSAIALAGLRGLATLDPAVEVKESADHRVELRYRDHVLAGYAEPLPNDVTGWSWLLERAVREATHHSRRLAKADDDLLTEAIFDGFLSKLDIFSHYAGPIEARDRRAGRNGFGGIGVRYDLQDGTAAMTEIIPDSPAAAAKLRVGEHIIAIDDERLDGLDQSAVAQKLRGPISSPIKLTLQGGKTIVLHRALIVPPSVTLKIDRQIARIAIAEFNQNTAASVTDAIRKAKASPGLKGLILDLRGNGGGLLDQSVTVADLFVAHGRILETRGRHPGAAESRDAKPGDVGEDLPLVTLIDGRTASAAEILAADLQDSGRAVLVGTNSFGKGAIQTVLDLPNHGEMTLTWSRFFAPSGYALHGLGVLPALCTAGNAKSREDRVLAGGRAAAPEFFATWRAAAPDDRTLRDKLRGHCPASNHADDEADLAIARHLLDDPALFTQALAVAETQCRSPLDPSCITKHSDAQSMGAKSWHNLSSVAPVHRPSRTGVPAGFNAPEASATK